jgi:hypothetical protein
MLSRKVCIAKVILTSPMNEIVVCKKFYIRSPARVNMEQRGERKKIIRTAVNGKNSKETSPVWPTA